MEQPINQDQQFSESTNTFPAQKKSSARFLGIGLTLVGLITVTAYLIYISAGEQIRELITPPTPTTSGPVVINEYPLLPFDEIQLDDSIPQYPGMKIDAKYRGKNYRNQNVMFFRFSVYGGANPVQIADFFRDGLSREDWIIQQDEGEDCLNYDMNEERCDMWHSIVAVKSGRILTYRGSNAAGYSIEVVEGEKRTATLNLPPDFPQGLIPPETTIYEFLAGFETLQDGFRFYLLEIETLPPWREHLETLETAGWSNCVYGSTSAGFASYHCTQGEYKLLVTFTTEDYRLPEESPITVRLGFPAD